MAVLEVVLRQRYYNQEIVNRWNYISSGTPAAVSLSFGLISAMGAVSLAAGSLIGKIREMQGTQVNFVDIEARDVYSDTDFYTRPFSTATDGTQPGENMSPVLAYGFRTSRVRRDVRRATKRFVGVTEANIDAGGIFTGTMLTLMGEVATLMSQPLTFTDEGNVLTYTPAVCGKKPPEVPPVTLSYAYWPTEAEQLEHTAQGFLWEVYDTVRTQNSRQYGRGR